MAVAKWLVLTQGSVRVVASLGAVLAACFIRARVQVAFKVPLRCL
jgi:hypothetical protein